ncbi:sugar kinase [Thermorudis peleae]|uniref:sugar kinase n=1 Tax=Thermorudis peleae TaxID=1382356 RepID=UPI000B0FFF71|nr:sugar kinase [Thermorudis peleae]
MEATPRWDVVSFGETMIRLSPPLGERLETATRLDVRIGGTESNVAVALARLRHPVAWCSALPDNPLGRRIAAELRWHGVDVSLVHWVEGGRVGVYYLDVGIAPRPTQVLYDRAGSAVATIDPTCIDPTIVRYARWLHLTGITPALSPNCRAIAHALVEAAQQAEIPLCFDVNYRSLLWSPEEAAETLAPFCASATVLICGRADAETLWGLHGAPEEVLVGLVQRFHAPITLLTLGDGGVLAEANGQRYHVPALPATVIDRIGAGDAFTAGVLHGLLERVDLAQALRYGVALAALKITMNGDLALITRHELEAALRGTARAVVR